MTANTHSQPVDKKELREFGLVFGGGLILFFGLLIPWIFDRPWPLWPWIAAAAFAVAALVVPLALRPLHYLWLKIGHALGWINTRIILGLVFLAVFLPVSLLMRVFGKDPMARKLDASASSYRVASESHPKERMERPF